ncbi:glycosyltransferase family 2 protein [Spirosoma sp. RP8]|uniref:Glycosyltransferase family 2 protein n=2 Tax=Spirosoma liriopis TaxID=2937440 RepID=A0ABT0HV67_9BACT|nr:glycosyltransferase family 2 protein [Spirosoma liriopis]
MNRTYHLKKTLIKNLEDNSDDQDLEYVLLNYNSGDDMEDWVKKDLQTYIDSGKLVYYRTYEPNFFSQSHSRNMAYKLASGDILCNIDADNFTGINFSKYVLELFRSKNIFLSAAISSDESKDTGILGRICLLKKDFLKIGGYDEGMKGYGYEDTDLKLRLRSIGNEEVFINKRYCEYIQHQNDVRVSNEKLAYLIKVILLKKETYYKSSLYFLYTNGECEQYQVIDNYFVKSKSVENCFYEKGKKTWKHGLNIVNKFHWILKDQQIELKNKKGVEAYFNLSEFSIIDIRTEIEEMYILKSTIVNRNLMEKSAQQNKIIKNLKGFGRGIVYKNFDLSKKITL